MESPTPLPQAGYPAGEAMPALLAMRQLDHEMEDGTSVPLSALGQAVLNDGPVIDRVLHVANHMVYNHNADPITTLGRAIGLLGFAQVKSVCITARLLETLLRDRCHSDGQREQWLTRMALAFHTAMQARQLMQDCDAEQREKAFLAALLQGLDSTAPPSTSAHCQQVVDAARQFCVAVRCGWHEPATAETISQVAALLGVSDRVAERRLRLCTHLTGELVELYGADSLLPYLPSGYGPHHNSQPARPGQSPEPAGLPLQMHLLYELAALVVEKPDFDLVLHTALEGIQRGLQMDRCLTCLVDGDRQQLVPRFALGRYSDVWRDHFTIPLANADNIFTDVVTRGTSRWVGSSQTPLTHPLCTPRMLHVTCGSECFIAPLQFGDRVIGILYADRYISRQPFTEADFQVFRHFTLQVRMCLQLAMQMD